jgi:hypothetical protein
MVNIPTHPVQFGRSQIHPTLAARVPVVVSMRAYEVYCHLWGKQEAMVTGECHGGFGVGEIVCLLYARSFPKEEWRQRYTEASEGMTLG